MVATAVLSRRLNPVVRLMLQIKRQEVAFTVGRQAIAVATRKILRCNIARLKAARNVSFALGVVIHSSACDRSVRLDA